MITVVVGKEIEKIKGDFESYLNGLNMVGEISYSQYSELYDEGTKQIQRAYELGKSELEKENARLKDGIALKDEEVGCIETDFNTFKSKAKEIIKNLMKFAEIDCREYEEAYKEAEQFVKE